MTVAHGRHRPSRVEGHSRLALLVSPSGRWQAVKPKHRLVSGGSIAAFAHPVETTHRLMQAVRRAT